MSGGMVLAALIGQGSGSVARADTPRLRIAQFAWACAGLLAVLYLVYVELVRLHRLCDWCTVVHLLILMTFLVTLRRVQTMAGPDERAPTSEATP